MFSALLTKRQPFCAVFNTALAADFYSGVRCALLHEARTKDGWIVKARGPVIAEVAAGRKLVYRNNFHDALLNFIDWYRGVLPADKAFEEANRHPENGSASSRFRPPNPLVRRERPQPMLIDMTPLSGALSDIRPILLKQVRKTADEALFNSLMEQHHYLGYEQPVGEHLKYLVGAHGQPIACMAWSSAPRHLGSRDRYIGWSAEARRRNIRFIAYNTRFLILPWIRVPHLASHILGRAAAALSADWERMYSHPVYFAETFIDPGRFRGTCYRAANWVLMGRTTGRGKASNSYIPNRSIKEVLGLALTPRFRELLSEL